MGRSAELQALSARLASLLKPLLGDSFFFPLDKALLSRDGGVCIDDRTRLQFDPLNPHEHRCPRCNRIHRGERHHRAWVWRYHLWLSERAIHLALLGFLRNDAALVQRSRDILDCYASAYRTFPNSDNVLGPTRLFFSTYLESIWLIQIVIASSIIEAGQPGMEAASSSELLDEMIAESSALIASFDEGRSNRQVWNNTALIAAGIRLNDERLVECGLDGPSGLRAQLVSAVGDEGLWFEGENYHFFALRGFLLAAELLRDLGVDLYGHDGPQGRLCEMFAAPLLTLLPDLTIPARGDSPFGVSIVQPRFAELWEIGWARTSDERLGNILSRLYNADVQEGEDPGLEEIAEQEQNRPPQRLARGLLGWKALLWMNPQPPVPGNPDNRESAFLRDTGLVVLQRDPYRYVSMECGGSPGGHGHPDLLHVTAFWGDPLFADFGTASYVAASLHWYRSALAHNSPSVSGIGQVTRDGDCTAFDSDGDWSWCRGTARDLFGPGTSAVRTLVVGPSVMVDLVEVTAGDATVVDLPVHPLGGVDEVMASRRTEHVEFESGKFAVYLAPRPGEELLILREPGPPDSRFADGDELSFLIRRARGSGWWLQCYAPLHVGVVKLQGDAQRQTIVYADGTTERIEIGKRTCKIVGRDSVTSKLSGVRTFTGTPLRRSAPSFRIACPLLGDTPEIVKWEAALPAGAMIELGERHYRRSEMAFGVAGEFTAKCAVFAVGSNVGFAVTVRKGDLLFRRADANDPVLDNELPDIDSDGIQCYVGTNGWSGYLVVPDPDSGDVRVTAVAGTAGDAATVRGSWCRTDDGYRVLLLVDVGRELRGGDRVPVNLVVNEMRRGRVRRSGQLVLSGGGGWVYLRGDRESPSTAAIAEVT